MEKNTRNVSIAIKGEVKDGSVTVVRYDRSFIARIIQNEDAKAYYAAVKNYCMSLGMKSRISWKGESFYLGDKNYLLVKMRGKTLTLYLALDPKEYEEDIYHHKDVSAVKAYEKCPMAIRIKSTLALRKAQSLIAEIARKNALSFLERTDRDYVAELPYEDTDALVLKGLVKEVESVMKLEDAERALAMEQEDEDGDDEDIDEVEFELAADESPVPAGESAVTDSEEEIEEVEFELESEEEEDEEEIAEDDEEIEEVEFDLEDDPEEVEFDLEDEPEDVEFELAEDEPEDVVFELASDGLVIEVKFDRSFTSRIIQNEAAKRYYSELKNHCDSFLMKSRVSWKADTYHIGRKTLLMMKVRGKTLTLYLALDPAAYDESIYHQKDVSAIKTYEKCPMMVRVRSDLALRKAKTLITELCAKEGLLEREVPYVDYVALYPYEDTAPLIERNLIKRVEHKLDEAASEEILTQHADEVRTEEDLADEARQYHEGEDADVVFKLASGDIRDPKAPEAYTTLGEEGRYVTLQKYVRGFIAKMKQGPYERKDRYAAVKSFMLGIKGVKVRESFVGETFSYGKQPLLKSRIRGKTLFLYFALNPDDYVQTVYRQQNKGDIKAFVDTPMMIKVKSEQGLARALQLVDELIRRYSLEKGERKSFRSEYHYEETETLVSKGLIKVKLVTLPRYEAERLLKKQI